MDRLAYSQTFSPFQSISVIRPVFVQRADSAIGKPEKADNVIRCGSVLREYINHRDECISVFIRSFNYTVPRTGVLTISPYELRNSELLICAMPSDDSILAEIFPDSIAVLCKNILPD